jgi:S1-C subfamily serine protease
LHGGRGSSRWERVIQALLFAALLFPGISRAQILKPEDIYQKLLPSVMTLHVENAQGETYIGTAFLALDKNVAVTAWHVVSDAVKVSAKFSDDRVVNVDCLIDKDEQHDLALIRLNASGPEVPLCIAKPAIGSRAYVIGAPKGFDFSITDGLISQIQDIHGSDQYQVSCPISGGNSGGPVVNERGQVVGIAAWTQRDAQNLSFAIPASCLSEMNPKHAPTRWDQLAGESRQISATSPGSWKIRESHGSVEELKQLLNGSAGEHVSITISRGDNEKKFDVVLPKDFVK